MLAIFIGGFTLLSLIVWGVYFIARIHALKFKNYSPHIVIVTRILGIGLCILTLLGYVVIFFYSDMNTLEKRSVIPDAKTITY